MFAMIGVLISLRLWIMDFKPPTFKVMDNPVAAAESLLVRVGMVKEIEESIW